MVGGLSRYVTARALSAGSPSNFGTDLAISVFWEMCQHCVFLNHFLVKELDDMIPKDKVLRCLTLRLRHPLDFRQTPVTNLANHATGLSVRSSVPVVRFIGLLGALLRVESCVEEEVGVNAELELETSRERPGTTVGTFSVLHGVFFFLQILMMWLLNRRNTHDLHRVIQEMGLADNLRGAVPSRIIQVLDAHCQSYSIQRTRV